jgi:hypothetical protein
MDQPGKERHQEKRGLLINEKGKKEETENSVHQAI